MRQKNRYKRLWSYFLSVVLTFAAGSCTQTDVEAEAETSPSNHLKEVEAHFSLNMLSDRPHTRSLTFTAQEVGEAAVLPVMPDTKAEASADSIREQSLYHLWFGQYDADGIQITCGYKTNLKSQTAIDLQLKQSEGISHVYLIANAGNLTAATANKTEAEFKALQRTGGFTPDGLPSANRCIMTGMWSGTVEKTLSGSIGLERTVAKISFTYTCPEVDGFSFTATSLQLCSVPQTLQYVAPTAQLPGITYTHYAAIIPAADTSYCWYLPENNAGIANGANAVTSEKQKTGSGILDATYISLTGDAVQNGITYPGVTFKLFPGDDKDGNSMNNYNILRNCNYAINISLGGIDFADKRVTVPLPAMTNPHPLDAAKDSTTVFEVITQPSAEWTFTLPEWLSARVGEREVPAGAVVTHNAPAKVTFTSASTNLRAEAREFPFTINEEEYAVTQQASVFSAPAQRFLSQSGTAFNLTITATSGLPWTISRTSGDENISVDLTNGTGTQNLTFRTTTIDPISATFTVSVTGTDPLRTIVVTVATGGHVVKGMWVTPIASSPMMTWSNAVSYCNNLTLEGYSDWRLPNYTELSDTYFQAYELDELHNYVGGGYQDVVYWTSTTAGKTNVYAMNNWKTNIYDQNNSNIYVRCIRSA